MSWLMLAKMPLLISSRMTSAGLTVSRSASSLTVMELGISMAPRWAGSSVWTTPRPFWAGLRGGLRGPRRLRVPLRLRATDASFGESDVGRREPPLQLPRGGGQVRVRGEGRPQRSLEGVFLERGGPAGPVGAEVGAATRQAAARVEFEGAGRRAHDPHQLPLGALGPAGDARARRYSASGCVHGGAYDATSPAGSAFFARLARLGFAVGSGVGSGAGSR